MQIVIYSICCLHIYTSPETKAVCLTVWPTPLMARGLGQPALVSYQNHLGRELSYYKSQQVAQLRGGDREKLQERTGSCSSPGGSRNPGVSPGIHDWVQNPSCLFSFRKSMASPELRATD